MYRTLILCSLLTLAACETEGLEATCAVGDVVDQTDPSVARMLHGAEVLDAGITTSTDGFDEAGDWLQVNSREFTVLLANGAQAGVTEHAVLANKYAFSTKSRRPTSPGRLTQKVLSRTS